MDNDDFVMQVQIEIPVRIIGKNVQLKSNKGTRAPLGKYHWTISTYMYIWTMLHLEEEKFLVATNAHTK